MVHRHVKCRPARSVNGRTRKAPGVTAASHHGRKGAAQQRDVMTGVAVGTVAGVAASAMSAATCWSTSAMSDDKVMNVPARVCSARGSPTGDRLKIRAYMTRAARYEPASLA